jgi:cytochrome c oxidase cbb3-type subunit 3
VSDFTNGFWSPYIAIITVASILACAALLWKLSTRRVAAGSQPDVTGHVWDGNLEEYNNPLPRWWIWLFYITIVFGLAYLALYPGLGAFKGAHAWTSRGQYEQEQVAAKSRYEPLYARYAAMDVAALSADVQARDMGQRLFLNNCAQCHASDARGGRGFPDLTDKDWLWGGDPQAIRASIAGGRSGMMPAWGAVLGERGVKDTAHYVLQLSGRPFDNLRAARGKALYETTCVACHGPDGKGNPALGAPDLTDAIVLYGGGERSLIETIGKGRNGVMPAWDQFLGDDKVHLLTAYVYGLSQPQDTRGPTEARP